MSAFSSFQNELVDHEIDLHPSELHGLLVGYLCGAGDSGKNRRESVYREWLGGDVPTDLLELASGSVIENLDEYADFEFRLLMPGDDAPIDERARAIALWCSGFLSGLGESGRNLDRGEGDAAEVRGDLARIAAMTEAVPEGEENESDLAEIEEFIRVGVLLVFSEIGGRRSH